MNTATLTEPSFDAVVSFPTTRVVHPHPAEAVPWSEEAILWLPGEAPLFGLRAIEARLAKAPGVRPRVLGGVVDINEAGDHAIERGDGLRAGIKLRYCRVWRRTPAAGDWFVVREVWELCGA